MQAAQRFGFSLDQVELRLYVGKFASKNEDGVRTRSSTQVVSSGPIEVFAAAEVVEVVRELAKAKQYRDNAVLATIKALEAAGALVD